MGSLENAKHFQSGSFFLSINFAKQSKLFYSNFKTRKNFVQHRNYEKFFPHVVSWKNLGKFLQGIFLIIPVIYPERSESATWSSIFHEVKKRRSKVGCRIKLVEQLVIRIEGSFISLSF